MHLFIKLYLLVIHNCQALGPGLVFVQTLDQDVQPTHPPPPETFKPNRICSSSSQDIDYGLCRDSNRCLETTRGDSQRLLHRDSQRPQEETPNYYKRRLLQTTKVTPRDYKMRLLETTIGDSQRLQEETPTQRLLEETSRNWRLLQTPRGYQRRLIEIRDQRLLEETPKDY